MKWLRLTVLGLCLGYLAAAPADNRADDPPPRDSRDPRNPPAFVAAPRAADGIGLRTPQPFVNSAPPPSPTPATAPAASPTFVPCTPRQAERVTAPPSGAAVGTFVPCRPVRTEDQPVVPVNLVVPITAPPAPTASAPPPPIASPTYAPLPPAIYTTAPRPLSAWVVRGQMPEGPERLLPSSDDVAAAKGKPLATLGSPVVPSQSTAQPIASVLPYARGIVPVQATTGGDEPPTDPSKVFIPPQPRVFPKDSSYAGTVTGLPIVGQPIVYDASAGSLFSDPVTNPRFWARAEALLWWTNGYHLPVLVTTAPATTPQNLQGVLGVPGTVVLYGGNNTNDGPVPGGRFTFGWNLDPCGTCGIMVDYFFLARKNDDFFASGPVLARPFFNINSGMPDRELTSTPGTNPGDAFKLRGSIAVDNFTDFQGGDVNFRNLLCGDYAYSLYGFAGFRYLDLHEKTTITENVISAAAVPGFPVFNPGNQVIVQDSFATRNQFYGGQVGLDGEIRSGRWFVGSCLQVGVGDTVQTITINGSQTATTLTGMQQRFVGGLLALPSNIGNFTQNRFGVVPQIGMRVGYNLTDNMRVFVGYDFLYWSSVVRPGDQIDTTLNVTQIPNFSTPGLFPPSPYVHPIVPFRTTGFLAQGLSAGFEWRY